MLHKATLFSYSWHGESESAALELVVDACTFLDIYPEPVCQETEKEFDDSFAIFQKPKTNLVLMRFSSNSLWLGL